MKIRGFPVDNSDFSYGGLYGMLPTSSVMAEMAERVEVLKGPSALLNGIPPFGSIGGNVNVVPKRAPDEDLTQATANYISGSQFGGHVDFGRRFGEDKQFGVRFNGVFRGRPDGCPVQRRSKGRSPSSASISAASACGCRPIWDTRTSTSPASRPI